MTDKRPRFTQHYRRFAWALATGGQMTMTRSRVTCLLLLAVAAVVSGCAIGRTTVLRAVDGKSANFSTVEMPNLEGGGNVPEEVKRSIPSKVIESLAKEKLFAKVVPASGDAAGVLLLKGQVVQYNPGSRAMRYLTGPRWGVGRGSVIVNVTFVDKNSAAVLAEATFEGEIKGGVFGGGIDETHDAIAEEIVRFVKTNFSR